MCQDCGKRKQRKVTAKQQREAAALAWLICGECGAKYQAYEGLFSSMFCPRHAEEVKARRKLREASAHQFAAFRTNEPGAR